MSEQSKEHNDTGNQGLDTEAAREILEQRADVLAKVEDEQEEDIAGQLIKFHLDNPEHFAIPYTFISEILACDLKSITPIPAAPEHILGLFNYRSEIITVLNIKGLFNVKNEEQRKQGALIIIDFKKALIGVWVDEVIENIEYKASEITPALPSNQVTKIEYVKSIYKGSVTVIDIENVLDDKDLIVNMT